MPINFYIFGPLAVVMNDQLVIHLTTATCPTGYMEISIFQYLKIARF